MDPKACLDEIRELIRYITEDRNQYWTSADSLELACLIKELDHWMSKGGFSPWEN